MSKGELPDTPTNRHYQSYMYAWKIEILERAHGWIWRIYHGNNMLKWGASPDASSAWRDAHKEFKEATNGNKK